MTIQQVECLTDGLSVCAPGGPFVLDRPRVCAVPDGIDVSFRIAGTDVAPRLHLTRVQLSSSTWDEMAAVLRHVATSAARGSQRGED